ncbi:alkyl sulfatase C-terminal domain-containing protein [Streptomyces sp. SL13]|jgi:hypothetical protein|uniref:Alkyl sulfatase C-terminal domain-containing protein n=1 Tax=Streptantibioticus silvisoli TaxID=2705255 RepID=A0AA90HAM8_9ACTN|nr:alkyl sulfatase C-terminal domain-containing protein [Streptantibioticus silvisoli]MDI5967173.1 alkyl sulfatase C-terminal domain-containing protein [Streptantibioticus silvisoli]MDI5973928.1 alkyl sulfatase C-terminal domain-containing protein [Streptantibioticus silvisoli]
MTSAELAAALEDGSLDLAAVPPAEFARIVRDVPQREAAVFMAGPHRGRVLDELFRRMAVLLRPEAVGDREVLLRWRITAPGGGHDTFETAIAGGVLTVTAHRTERAPRLTLTMAAPELLRLAAGLASGPALFLTRRLSARGDLLVAAALTRWFDLPRG